MKLNPFGNVQSFQLCRKPRKLILTEEGENDPSIPPAILVEHVQWRYVFFTNLFSVVDQLYYFFDTRNPEVKLALYWQYLQAWVSLGFSRYPPNASTKSLAHEAQESPGGGSKIANSPALQRICNPLKQER